MRAPTLVLILLGVALAGPPMQTAYAQHEKQPFCLQSATGSLNCTYDSLDQCHQVLGGRSASGTCIANPARSETTGVGGTRSLDRPPNSRDHPPTPTR